MCFNWIATHRRMKLDSYFSPCTKINSKWFKNLNVRTETLTEKNTSSCRHKQGLWSWNEPTIDRQGLVQSICWIMYRVGKTSLVVMCLHRISACNIQRTKTKQAIKQPINNSWPQQTVFKRWGIARRGDAHLSSQYLGGWGRWISVSLRPAWFSEQVPGQPGLYRETLSWGGGI